MKNWLAKILGVEHKPRYRHITFVFDGTKKTFTAYLDGQQHEDPVNGADYTASEDGSLSMSKWMRI